MTCRTHCFSGYFGCCHRRDPSPSAQVRRICGRLISSGSRYGTYGPTVVGRPGHQLLPAITLGRTVAASVFRGIRQGFGERGWRFHRRRLEAERGLQRNLSSPHAGEPSARSLSRPFSRSSWA
jgi:hypothetical protein